jgi:hypothetical protein
MVLIDQTVLGVTTYKEVKTSRKEQQEWHQAEVDQEILMWLTTTDYSAQQSDFLSRRQEGTGQWLLDSNQFQMWRDGEIQTLFCQGMPGAGKTIMTSIVILSLHQISSRHQYRHCTYNATFADSKSRSLLICSRVC